MQQAVVQGLSHQENSRLPSATLFLGQETLNWFFQDTVSTDMLNVEDTARRSRREFMIYFCLDSRRDDIHYTTAWIQAVLPGFDAIWLAEMYRQRLNDILKREFGFNPKREYIHSVEFPLPLCDDAVLEIRERVSVTDQLLQRRGG